MKTLDKLFRRQRFQNSLILEGSGIAEDSLEIRKGYAARHRTREGWGLNSESQVEDLETGQYVQILCEGSAIPITCIEGKVEAAVTKDAIDKVAAEVTDEQLAYIEDKEVKDRQVMFAGIIASVVCLTIVILVVAQLFASGKLHF